MTDLSMKLLEPEKQKAAALRKNWAVDTEDMTQTMGDPKPSKPSYVTVADRRGSDEPNQAD